MSLSVRRLALLLTLAVTPACGLAADPPIGSIAQALTDGGTDDAGAPPDLSMAYPPPSARIQPMTWSSGGFLVGPGGFYDATFSTRCMPTTASDGEIRCLPTAWLSEPDSGPSYFGVLYPFFADSACTQPVLLRDYVRNPGIGHFQIVKSPPNSVYRLLAAPSRGKLYWMDSMGCAESWADGAAPYWILAELIPPSSFAKMELH